MQNKATPTASTQRVCRQLKTWRTIALGLFLGIGGPASGDLDMDVDGDGLNDVWQGIYDAWDLVPGGDEDGDGCSNLIESVAGTNPRVSGDCLKVGDTYITGTNVFFVFDAKVGKKYRILSSDTPGGGYGLVGETLLSPDSGTEFVATNDTSKTLRITKPVGSRKFYKLETSDVDSNSDGVSDWVAQKLGYNPNAESVDLDANGKSDLLDLLEGELGEPDKVTVEAALPFASEDGPQSGSFVVKRQRSLFDATVSMAFSGSANGSTDYSRSPVSNTVDFMAGEKEKTIFINPNPGQSVTVEGSESVTLALTGATSTTPGGAPEVGTPGSATIIIQDSTVATGTGLLARYYDNGSTTYDSAVNFGDTANYAYTRGGATPNFTGSIVITPTGVNSSRLATLLGALTANTTQVKLTFTGGNLNTPTYNHQSYLVTGKTSTTFTCSVPSGAGLPATSSNSCGFSILPLHPPVIERVDSTVNYDWIYGTANAVGTVALAGTLATNVPDQFSNAYETFLSPDAAGSYRFQLDADDRARVLIDLNRNGVFDLPGEQVVEHGWDSASTVTPEDGVADNEVIGAFKISGGHTLEVPTTAIGATGRYRMRVEHVETEGSARCRLQWSLGTATFANIPQARQFTHTVSANYTWSRTNATTGLATVTLTGHGLLNGETVAIAFASRNLFTPNTADPAGYNSINFTVANATATTFQVAVTGTNLPATDTTSGTCFLEERSASTTTGVYNKIYGNTNFASAPVRVGVDTAVTFNNNGVWGEGTPDPVLINPETFSVRWTGQVQPQFTEEYTFIVQADDGCVLRINGQQHDMRPVPSTTSGGSYLYDSATGGLIVNYVNTTVRPGAYTVGEVVRLDPSSGNLSHGTAATTYTYDASTGVAIIDYSALTNITPGSIQAGHSIELDPTAGTASSLALSQYEVLASPAPTATTFAVNFAANVFASQTTGVAITVSDNRNAIVTAVYPAGNAAYTYTSASGVTVVDYTNSGFAPNTFEIGMSVILDPTNNALTNEVNAYRTISAVTATTFTVSYGTGLSGTNTGNITIVAPGLIGQPASQSMAFAVAMEPGRYAINSAGNVNLETVNKALRDFANMSNERFVRLPMVGGTRYDIQLDYLENTGYARCQLSWFSPSQPKQIIPSNRLYPTSGPQAPPAHLSSTEITGLVGDGDFSIPVVVGNGGSVSFEGLPAWLSYANGQLTGTPPADAEGKHQIVVTMTSPAGQSKSVINLSLVNAGGAIAREVWSGIAGTSLASIPTGTVPTSTTSLSSLEAPTDAGDNYGARIRGYLTAPLTGNYYFWIAGSNAAELRISNDAEPVNIFRRAWVNNGSGTPQTWNAEVNQKSAWLAMQQGKRYYIEILHKAGTGVGDNLAIGWAKPGEDGAMPSEVVPGYALTPWTEPVAPTDTATIYAATMRPQAGAVTNASGSSFLRVNAAETEAIISINYTGLTSDYFGMHVHDEMIPGGGLSNVIADLDEPGDVKLLADGTYEWVIKPTAGYTVPQLVQHLKDGKVFFNVHSVNYPGGEIKGYFGRLDGSQTFTVPAAPPTWTNDHTTNNQAVRFLTQATFGASVQDVAALKAMASYEAWIDDQFTKGPSYLLPEVIAQEGSDANGGSQFDEPLAFNSWWRRSISGEDQLRQRVAFALSQILVVSGQGPLDNRADALAYFYDKLLDHSFGNFRDLLEEVTLTPAMGRYLDMRENDKPDLSVGRIPNENYAREIKQLFSVGLFRMWPDGSLMLNSRFEPIDVYTQREIVGYAHVFTGWDDGYDGAYRTSIGAPANWMRQMREIPARHYTGPKRILNNEVLPGLTKVGSQPLDPYATHNSMHWNDPAYQALPNVELDATHDQLFNHPNVGPFICRQLIQRMVTSHPSRGYVYRVVQKFNDNGSGVRGDMRAVIKAILLDYEARHSSQVSVTSYGKQREPVMRVAAAGRAFRGNGVSGTWVQPSTTQSTAGAHVIEVNAGNNDPKLAAGRSVFLEFEGPEWVEGDTTPSDGVYTVLSTPSPTTTAPFRFYVNARGWVGVNSGNGVTNGGLDRTYNIPPNSTEMTVTFAGHWLPAGGRAFLDFELPSGPALTDGVYVAATSNSTDSAGGSTFTVTVPANATERSGRVRMVGFRGSFTVSNSGLPSPNERRITFDTTDWHTSRIADHHLRVGEQVYQNFTAGNPMPQDGIFTIESVPDSNTFTVLTTAAIASNGTTNNDGDNGMWMFPLVVQPKSRSGNAGTRPSTFQLGNTDADLEQSPLNSETVFNFFLPDYKYSGPLAVAGLTTPEFQLTAETTVIRQANYLFNGVFAIGDSNGISSFNNGSHGLVMDFSSWYGNAVSTAGTVGAVLGAGSQTGQTWTSNANLSTLISRLNTLLVAGQLPTAATDKIRNFVGRQISSITLGNPCTITYGTGTANEHGLQTGDSVTISGVSGGTFSPTINGAFTVTRVDANRFTIPVNYSNATGINLGNSVCGVIPYSNSSPTDTNKRDRLRAIIHLILTSPDFTIQR